MNSNHMYKAAAYLRLSREDGDLAEGSKLVSNSIANQKELVLDFINKQSDIELNSIYIDDGYSGVNFDRPEFQKMLEDIRQGTVNCVIVKDLSRFGRNYIESGRYIEKIFPMLGVRFIAITDNFDSLNNNYGNDMVVPFKNLINDAYCRDISVKVRSHLDMKRKNGEFIGAFAAYGYQKDENDKNHLVIDEYAAAIVEDIFNWKIGGMSNQNIADKLNREGILSPMEYKRSIGIHLDTPFRRNAKALWSHSMIRSILKNEIYIGTLVQGKRSTPNYKIKSRVNKKEGDWIRIPKAHQAIISEEMFRIVQNLLERDTRTSPKEDHVYLFSGMLSCGDCGEAMVRKTVKSGAKHYAYYICSGNKKDKNSCSPHRISEKSLAEVVLKSVQMYISHVLQMKNALAFIEKDSYIRANTKKQEDLVRKKKEELDKLNRRKLDLYEDLKDGILTKREYEQLRTQYDSQLADAEQTLSAMKEKLQMALQNKSEKLEWIEIFSRYQGITELNRNTIVTLIESITIYSADRVVIQYKFHKEYEALKEYIASWHDGKEAV